jgi:hypothetical protein
VGNRIRRCWRGRGRRPARLEIRAFSWRSVEEGPTMEFELSKIDAAVDQLDWAIRLLLDHREYVAAITLASTAEEILGRAVENRAAVGILRKKFAADFGLEVKVASQDHLNKAKNWLKHWDRHRDDGKIRLELDEEALQYIVRALANLSWRTMRHNRAKAHAFGRGCRKTERIGSATRCPLNSPREGTNFGNLEVCGSGGLHCRTDIGRVGGNGKNTETDFSQVRNIRWKTSLWQSRV